MKTLNFAAGLAGALGLRFALRRLLRRSVAGCNVVITGGSRGLGLELARVFGKRGARIAICARDREELARARNELHDRGIEAYAFSCDLTDEHAVREFIVSAMERLGGIDILINNAGRIDVGPCETMTDEDFWQSLRLHLFAPLWTIRAALPSLRERRGRVVNIASIGGLISVPHLLPYSVSKFALVALSEGLHAELARYGIHVTTVCPGLMRTGSTENAHFKSQHRKEYAWFALSDAMPLSSVSAHNAATMILRATEMQKAFTIISPQAWMAAMLHAQLPNAIARILSIVARLLPGPGGIGTERMKGAASHGALPAFPERLMLATLERAAKDLNQL